MPIYAYACGACGFKKDVLQKLSDAPLTDCPSCGKSAFSKQLTAPGFVLKGSGWYVTDFREGQKKPTEANSASGESTAGGDSGNAASAASQAKPGSDGASGGASTPSASSAPAAASGASAAAGGATAAAASATTVSAPTPSSSKAA
jgi:putative FmdB family regulatory protein